MTKSLLVMLMIQAGKLCKLNVNSSIEAGSPETTGQVIGTAQNLAPRYGSGMSNHVHVKLRINGEVVNPADHIP